MGVARKKVSTRRIREGEWPFLVPSDLRLETDSLNKPIAQSKLKRINYDINSQQFDFDFHRLDENQLKKEDVELVLNGMKPQRLVRPLEHTHVKFGFKMRHMSCESTQKAGLIYYVDENNYDMLYSSYDEKRKKYVLNLQSVIEGEMSEHPVNEIVHGEEIALEICVNGDRAQFLYQQRNGSFARIGHPLSRQSVSRQPLIGMHVEGGDEARFRDVYYAIK